MLSPNQVRARRAGGVLQLTPLVGKKRARAVELAAEVLATVRALEGERRNVVEAALAGLEATPSERRLVDGLEKLALDLAEFARSGEVDAPALRRAVFELAAERRRALGPGESLDRAATLGEAAASFGLGAEAAEAALYADLPSEERLIRAARIDAEALVARYDLAVRQAVLLRAVRVTADVRLGSAQAYRALFAKLKFRRLLHRIERTARGYRLVIDGPFSLFESTTKYGLELALILPVLEQADELELSAEIRWGPRREALLFRHRSARAVAALDEPPELTGDVKALLEAFARLETPWRAQPATSLIDLPGLGVTVPDIEMIHSDTGERVFVEVLGFWSRDAVWKRVELAERGLPEKVLFAVSSRLRVSEAVLEENPSAALYVYKGVMSARAVERRLDELVRR